MIELLKWLHDLFKEKRLIYIVIVLIVIYFVDDYFGWSYYSRVSNQVQIIKDINECLKDTSLSLSEVEFLNQKRDDVINRQSKIDEAWSFSTTTISQNFIGNGIWDYLCYQFLYGTEVIPLIRYILLNFGIYIIGIIEAIKIIKNKSLKKNLVNVFILSPVIFFVTFFTSWFYGLIPVFSVNHIWINYVLFFLIGLMIFITTKNQLKKLV